MKKRERNSGNIYDVRVYVSVCVRESVKNSRYRASFMKIRNWHTFSCNE